MALIGITLNRENPPFTISDFTFWMPQFNKYLNFYEGKILVGNSYKTASVYKNNLSELTIGNYIVNLTTADGVIYTGELIVSVDETTISYSATLNSQTMSLSLSDGSVTTNCTLASEGAETFNRIYSVVNGKIFKSIFGSDWQLAMSYAIAHYLTLIAQQVTTPSGNTLQGIAGGGVTRGVLANAQVGNFSKSYQLDATLYTSDESLWWNQTSYGAALITLYKTKGVPSILVVTSNPVPGAI